MSVLIPARFPSVDLAAAVVGRPVGYGWIDTIGAALAFLQGRIKHVVCAADYLSRAHGARRFLYTPSRGARVLVVVIGLHESADATTTQTVTLALSSATLLTGAPLDGSAAVACPTARFRTPQQYVALFDVSKLVVGTLYELVVTSAAGAGTSYGVRRVAAYEVPRDATNAPGDPANEPGINPAFGQPGTNLYAGSVSTSGDVAAGMERVLGQLDDARATTRRFVVNLASVEDTTNAWSLASTSGSYLDLGTPYLRTRAKRLYAAAAAGNTLQARIRYALNGTTATLRFKSSAGTTYDLALANTGGAWTGVTGTVKLDTNLGAGSNAQEDYWTISANVGGAGKVLYVSAIAAVDNES